MRVNMMEESAVVLDEELQSANGPLSSYLASRLTLLLNAYYLNLAGSLDNLAWAIIYHHSLRDPVDENCFKQRRFAQLLGNDFLAALGEIGLTGLKTGLSANRDWYWEMKEFRDPAAHRIPLLVPCSLYSEQDVEEASRLGSEAAKAFARGDHREGMKTFRRTNQLGRQIPVFVSESTSVHVYDLAGRINLDHANWYALVEATLSQGFA